MRVRFQHTAWSTTALLGLGVALLPLSGGADAASAATGPTLTSLSTRADMVSGSTDLLGVTLPPGADPAQARITVNGRAVSSTLHRAPAGAFAVPGGPTHLLLVKHLTVGANTVRVTAAGQSSQLVLTSHRRGAPVFSGPQARPWTCTTKDAGLGEPRDRYCNAPARTSYFYMPKGQTGNDSPNTGVKYPQGQFKAYDPQDPPPRDAVDTITTDTGRTVPYIVRSEIGTVNRGIYQMTILAEPGKAYTPWRPPPGWDHKVTYVFGGGCGLKYSQSSLQDSALDDWSLARGRAVLTATTSTTGTNCQTVTGAETVMELKQHLVDRYGPVRFTTSYGCSGGAIMPTQIADAYPGLIDGVLPNCSYPDLWSPLLFGVHDCTVLQHYFKDTAAGTFTAKQMADVQGEPVGSINCALEESQLFPAYTTTGDCAGAASYSSSNPRGVKCDLFTRFRDQLGMDGDGYVKRPADNVGVQYGLKALRSGSITVDQFLDLNRRVGGLDRDGAFQAARTTGDADAVRRMYRNDLIMSGTRLGDVPVLDARSDWNHDMHDNSQYLFTHQRVLRSTGTAPNHVQWFDTTEREFGLPSAALEEQSKGALDRWVSAITSDSRTYASPAAKATANRPAGVRNSCFVAGQQTAWTPGSVCEKAFTYYGDARVAAGGPLTNDVVKCRLQAPVRSSYGVAFTQAQWTALRAAFPAGVCDYSRPGQYQSAPTGTWLTYGAGPDGRPAGPAPVSTTG